MRRPTGMALFGMVWLLRVRSEMKRCAKCRRDVLAQAERDRQSEMERTPASCSTFFTIDTPGALPSTEALISPERLAPTTYCEVHGFNPPKEDIQEFYELTLLDENKSVQEKTAETIRIANKWEANDGPITPSYTNNDLALLFALLATVYASVLTGQPSPLLHAAPVAPLAVASIEPHDPNPQYSYGYEVNDPLTGDSHGQVESRSGDVVRGSYALVESDGTRRVVDYSADPINGFNAVVSKNPIENKVVAAPAVSIRRTVGPVPVAVAPQPVAVRTAVASILPAIGVSPLGSEPIVRVAPIVSAGPWASDPIVKSIPVGSAGPVVSAGPWAGPALRAGPWAAPALRSAPVW